MSIRFHSSETQKSRKMFLNNFIPSGEKDKALPRRKHKEELNYA